MKTTFMKLKIFTLMGLLALVAAFSLTISREAKAATDLGYSFETSVGIDDLEVQDDGTRTVQAYSPNGQNFGSYTYDFSNFDPDNGKKTFTVTFQSPKGKMVFDVTFGDNNLPLLQGDQLLFAGEITNFTEKTGAYRDVARMIFRCQFTVEVVNGIPLPTICHYCIHLFIRDWK